MTHAELVRKAVAWLKNAKQCNPVFGEKGSQAISEFPDAIGFSSGSTVVVECKVSLADLRADKKKSHRQDESGMGDLRYYMLPRELYEQAIKVVFDWAGWGVVVCDEYGGYRQMRGLPSSEFKSNLQAERDFLRSRVLEIQLFGTR